MIIENTLIDYVKHETRPFDEFALNDCDLLVFSTLIYSSFENYDVFTKAGSSVKLSALGEVAPLYFFVENGPNISGTLALLDAVCKSPRFANVALEGFEEANDEARGLQYGCGFFVISPEQVVVAYRGTTIELNAWREDLNMGTYPAVPCQIKAMASLTIAHETYPQATLCLCGHSKGGACAEYAALFTPDIANDAVERCVSFDGPALTRVGTAACPELQGYDELVEARYAATDIEMVRYVFPAAIGLMLENGSSAHLRFAEAVDASKTHDPVLIKVEEGQIVCHEPSKRELTEGGFVSRWASQLTLEERVLFVHYVITLCAENGITVDLSSDSIIAILRAALKALPRSSGDQRRNVAHMLLKALKALKA